VLYTDGISEAADATGEQFGEERLYQALSALPRAPTQAHSLLRGPQHGLTTHFRNAW